MCGRYTLYKTKDIAKRFAVEIPGDTPLQANYNVAPTQTMPVVVQSPNTLNRLLAFMRWGLIPRWAKDPSISSRLINARSETAFNKPSWRNIIRTQRCLIPADGFYEWRRNASQARKQPFYIHPKQDGLFAFAGVWEYWKNPEDETVQTYSIMTTEPNKEISQIHNRMPVILYPEEESSWLNPANNRPEDITPLLHPYEDNGLEMYKISSSVNTPRNNDRSLINPLTAS